MRYGGEWSEVRGQASGEELFETTLLTAEYITSIHLQHGELLDTIIDVTTNLGNNYTVGHTTTTGHHESLSRGDQFAFISGGIGQSGDFKCLVEFTTHFRNC